MLASPVGTLLMDPVLQLSLMTPPSTGTVPPSGISV